MLGAVLSFAAMAVAVRELQLRHMGSFEILFLRSIVMLAVGGVIAALVEPGALRTQRLPLHVLRNSLHFVGQYLWYYSISALTLATVFAIEFTMPVWVALLAAFFLGERLNHGRVLQLVLGLVGVMIILRPGSEFFQTAALVMVVGSICFSASMICTKKLSATDSALTVLLWMSLMQAPVALIGALPSWQAPTMADLPWILMIGASSFTAHYSIINAFRLADAAVVVPIDFLRLPLIALVGAMFYAEPFDPMVVVGAAIIFTGSYYSLRHETRR
jgi:drug/metabolite transporter (DMT)-like permease